MAPATSRLAGETGAENSLLDVAERAHVVDDGHVGRFLGEDYRCGLRAVARHRDRRMPRRKVRGEDSRRHAAAEVFGDRDSLEIHEQRQNVAYAQAFDPRACEGGSGGDEDSRGRANVSILRGVLPGHLLDPKTVVRDDNDVAGTERRGDLADRTVGRAVGLAHDSSVLAAARFAGAEVVFDEL